MKEDAKDIRIASKELTEIIDGLIDIETIDNGKLELMPEDYNVNEMFDNVINISNSRIKDKNIKFISNIDKDIPEVLFGDQAKLEQILLNIINNSIKYTKKGEISLNVDAVKSRLMCRLKISIKDTGSGMKQEEIDSIFNENKRLENNDSEKLGLIVAKKLLELMNGKIDINSVYGEGYVGNHTTGGGILLKYTMDGEEEFTVNNGGPYNGRFNDVLIEDDGYVVVGLGKSNSGVIIKYDENGEQLWSSSYGYTDEKGINAISKLNDNYITATTKVIDKDDLSNYQAAIVVFDENGEKLEDIKYSSDNITSFNDIAVDSEGNVFTCGYTGKLDSNNQLVSNAIVLKYDKDLYKDSEDIIKGEKSDFYTRIYLDDKEVYLLGYSNSDLNSNFNGYDYFPMVKKYNSSLK